MNEATETACYEGPVRATVTAENQQRVQRAIADLPESLRCVVILRHYEQLRFREIAEVLGVPEGTVASRMATALDRLGRVLRESD